MEVEPIPGSLGQMTSTDTTYSNGYSGFEDEPPLLEG